MHVIRHYHPSQQPVTLRIEGQQRCLHHIGDGWLAQNARAVTGVDPGVHALATFDVSLRGGESLQFGFQLQKDRLRKAVGEMKGDVLGRVGTFKVGKIAAAVPPGSAIRSANLPIGVFSPAKLSWEGIRGANLGVIHTANREIGVPPPPSRDCA